MKCVYNAGILDRFLDNDISFDYVIGVSAGSANAASFLAAQRGRNLRFYTEHSKNPEYFGARPFLRDGNLFNLTYVYGNLTNSDGSDPLDYDALMVNPAEYEIVATDAGSGEPHYFSKHDLKKDDYRIIMASCAMPGACQPVEVDGRMYYDGGVSDSIPVGRALFKGCDRVVVLLSNPRDYVKQHEHLRGAYTLLCRQYPEIIRRLNRRHIDYMKEKEYLLSLESQGRAFVFCPSESHISAFTMNTDELKKMYESAVSDYDGRSAEFESFIKS